MRKSQPIRHFLFAMPANFSVKNASDCFLILKTKKTYGCLFTNDC
jgi:hypothetical protein